MIIIDRLTKLLCLIPCNKTDTAQQSAHQFIKHWYFSGKGLPSVINSDRDSKFTSVFWTEIGIQQELATSRHQSANGQAEIQVRIVKKVIRKFANYSQDN